MFMCSTGKPRELQMLMQDCLKQHKYEKGMKWSVAYCKTYFIDDTTMPSTNPRRTINRGRLAARSRRNVQLPIDLERPLFKYGCHCQTRQPATSLHQK